MAAGNGIARQRSARSKRPRNGSGRFRGRGAARDFRRRKGDIGDRSGDEVEALHLLPLFLEDFFEPFDFG